MTQLFDESFDRAYVLYRADSGEEYLDCPEAEDDIVRSYTTTDGRLWRQVVVVYAFTREGAERRIAQWKKDREVDQ